MVVCKIHDYNIITSVIYIHHHHYHDFVIEGEGKELMRGKVRATLHKLVADTVVGKDYTILTESLSWYSLFDPWHLCLQQRL